ncbi:NAD(P)/FAD-dependent oxidoreductase [Halocola ammonii]
MNIPDLEIPRVVIVGGGFAGLNLAKQFKGKDVQVVMFDKNNYHTFQPLLYQVATAGLEPDSIAYPHRNIFKNHRNFTFRMAEVLGVKPKENQVVTNIGVLDYDYLVLCTGSITNFFGQKQIEEESMPMKSVPEALNIRSLILQNFEAALLTEDLKERESLMNIVIVGGGPTGVELAGALAELKKHVLPKDYPDLDLRQMKINLVEGAGQLLPPMSEEASAKAKKYLKDLGVNIWLNTMITDYDGKRATANQGKPFLSQTLIWAAGVKGSTVQGIPADSIVKGNRVEVDRYSRVKGSENIYCIGDLAFMKTEKFPEGHPQLAQVAIQQGKRLGKNILLSLKGKEPIEFEYSDPGSMATIGRNKAVVDLPNWKFQGAFAWFVWMFIHLIALVGFRNKMLVLFNWMYNYFRFARDIRLIIRPYKRNDKKEEPLLKQEQL